MRIKIDTGEWYPVYAESLLDLGHEVEIPEELWRKYMKAREEFSDLLSEVETIVEDQQ